MWNPCGLHTPSVLHNHYSFRVIVSTCKQFPHAPFPLYIIIFYLYTRNIDDSVRYMYTHLTFCFVIVSNWWMKWRVWLCSVRVHYLHGKGEIVVLNYHKDYIRIEGDIPRLSYLLLNLNRIDVTRLGCYHWFE